MATRQWFSQWRSNLLWSGIVGAVVGLVTNLGSSKIMEQTPAVSVTTSVSYNAGQTVADTVILNSGDLPLRNLHSQLDFQNNVVCSVAPRIMQPAVVNGARIELQAPRGVELASGDAVSIRCVSTGPNAILNNVADKTTAIAVVERRVVASARPASEQTTLVRLLIAGLALLAILITLVSILVVRTGRPGSDAQSAPPQPQEEVSQ